MEVAQGIATSLPVVTINLLLSPQWKGGPLLTLPESKGIKTCTAKEVSMNYWFIKPVVAFSPHKAGCWQKCLDLTSFQVFKTILNLTSRCVDT